MFGIRFTILREGDIGGMPETIYLRTYRRGEAGIEMRKQLRSYHALDMQKNKAAVQIPTLVAQAQKCIETGSPEGLLDVAAKQDLVIASATAAAEQQLQVAEQIAELALKDNYGEKLDSIVDKLTDRELHAIVGTIELGEMPRDFFQSLEARQKRNSTGQSGASPDVSSSVAVSPATMSNQGK